MCVKASVIIATEHHKSRRSVAGSNGRKKAKPGRALPYLEIIAKPLMQIANGFRDGEKRRALLILDSRVRGNDGVVVDSGWASVRRSARVRGNDGGGVCNGLYLVMRSMAMFATTAAVAVPTMPINQRNIRDSNSAWRVLRFAKPPFISPLNSARSALVARCSKPPSNRLTRSSKVANTVPHGTRDHCKTLTADRQLFLVRDSYIRRERKGRWLSPGRGEKACSVDSGWTFRPLKRPRPRE